MVYEKFCFSAAYNYKSITQSSNYLCFQNGRKSGNFHLMSTTTNAQIWMLAKEILSNGTNSIILDSILPVLNCEKGLGIHTAATLYLAHKWQSVIL